MSAADLAAALGVFNEAALVALANKGVVRRAARDVEEGKVKLVSVEGDGARVAADGETIAIGPAGPAKASCTCPAPGICRHRIAAVLLLQAGAGEAPSGDGSEEDRLPALLAEVAAIEEEALRRFAGRAAWRAALEMAEAGAEILADGPALRILLADGGAEVRYLPGLGLEGMVSKVPAARRKAMHAAALIAARRQAGVEPEAAPEPVEEIAKSAGSAPDRKFLDDIRGALAEACRGALSLAPVALEERLFTLSVSSRADALPRLGTMLRVISRMVRDKRARAFRFDPDRCLASIAEADALARALAAVEDSAQRVALMGGSRRTYGAPAPLRLRGFGAETWRATSGARGVTAYFYDPENDRWLTSSLARGAGMDPSFDAAKAFTYEAVWGGATLSRLATADIDFDAAATSEDGRLSTSVGRPTVHQARWPAPDDWPTVLGDWGGLEGRLHRKLGGSLSSPAAAMEPVVLRIQASRPPYFDDLGQILTWPVADANGAWLALTLGPDQVRADRFEPLAETLASGWTGDVLAAATAGGTAFELRPVALIDSRGLVSIDLDDLPRPSGSRRAWIGIRAALQRTTREFVAVRKPAGSLILDQIGSVFTGVAELGGRGLSESDAAALTRLGSRASRAGLEVAANAVARVREAPSDALPSALLACCYAVNQLRARLLPLPMLAAKR